MADSTSPRLAEAFSYAEELHRGQTRKKIQAPTISHLMAVCSLVMEHGGDEDQAIAALLHDGPEDCGGQQVLDDIDQRFGERVAKIVADCTDTLEDPKPAWQPRKETYLEHLTNADGASQLVSVADKVHNARSLLTDYRQVGEALWDRFSSPRDQTLWYYRELLRIFQANDEPQCRVLTRELQIALRQLEEMVAATET